MTFASHNLSKSEKNYGQIENEMLAIAWGCEKFHDYIYGRSDITVETDHKPLIGSALLRLQRMMLRIQKYSFHVIWQKGTDLIIADTFRRALQPFTKPNNSEEYKVHSVRNLPISDVRILFTLYLAKVRQDQQQKDDHNFTKAPDNKREEKELLPELSDHTYCITPKYGITIRPKYADNIGWASTNNPYKTEKRVKHRIPQTERTRSENKRNKNGRIHGH